MKSRWRMPVSSLIVLGLALMVSAVACAEETDLALEATTVASQVDRVLLYSDRALVVRVGTVKVSKGRSYIAFEGLPEKLIDRSVAAALPRESAKVAEIANIQVEPVFKTTFRDEDAKAASEKLERLKQDMQRLANQLKSTRSARAFTEKINIGTRPRGAQDKEQYLPLEPDTWAAMLDYLDEEFQSASERELQLIEKADDLQAQIVVAAAKAEMLLSYKTRKTHRVVLEIQAGQPVQCDVALSYMVTNAAWFPRYDVRADLKANTVEIISYAVARQESGEDWSKAALAFSAAEPSVAADLPKLASWRITVARPVAEYGANVIHFDGKLQWQKEQPRRGKKSIAVAGAAVQRRLENQAKRRAAEVQSQIQTLRPRTGGRELMNVNVNGQAAGLLPQAKSSRSYRLAEQLGRVQDLVQAQEQAVQKKDWGAMAVANTELEVYFGEMAKPIQAELQDVARYNYFNRRLVERQLASGKLAKGLVPPVQSSGGYDYRWQALRREDVPSDGALTKVVLLRRKFPAEFIYEIAAAKSKLAFLKTTLKNKTKSPFLTGPVSVFLGSDFVGESRLNTCAPNEEFSLGLGADEQILVERTMQTKRNTRGTFTTQYRFNVDTTVTIRNNKRQPITVAVYERLPYTWDSELDISSGRFVPQPTRVDLISADKRRPALMCWEMDLGPDEKKDIQLGYWFQHGSDRIAVMKEDSSRKW